MTRIAIVGFGLVGGSLALALRRAEPDWVIVAVDYETTFASAAARQAAHECVDAMNPAEMRAKLKDVDLAVLCTPVRTIETSVVDMLELAGTVTDCGSTKRSIVRAASSSPKRARFVPGHPMAGAPESGIAQARADLFEHRRWILCPEATDADALDRVERLVRRVGAEPVLLSAEHHDRAVALTSHVPQILASVLWTAAERADALPAAGPAFASATRVAGGPERMWNDILETNADNVADVLASLSTELGELGERLRRSPPDLEALLGVLATARQRRSSDT